MRTATDTGDAFVAGAPYPAGVEQPWPAQPGPAAPPSRGLPDALSMPHPEHTAKVLELLLDLEHGRQALLDQLWAEIAAQIDERGFIVSGQQVSVSPQTTGLERITCVVAAVPSAGILQLGDWQLPVPQGVTVLPNVEFLLTQGDVRTLTITGTAGFLSLRLTGKQLPTRGVLAG